MTALKMACRALWMVRHVGSRHNTSPAHTILHTRTTNVCGSASSSGSGGGWLAGCMKGAISRWHEATSLPDMAIHY